MSNASTGEGKKEAAQKEKLPISRGYELWGGPLRCPKFVLAPMVDASELAWRMLSRKYGAQLCYTPMLHANVFVKDARYRRDALTSCPEDRPLIVQFCANDPDTFVAACRLAGPHCDAVDLNLGCPQAIARKGHYGAFLQDEWDLIASMISRAVKETGIPITAKIRVFEAVSKTVDYALHLEASGASLLTVHGRTKEQKGPLTGLASWEHIKAVKDEVGIPVIANGNIQYLSDVTRCFLATGADGVMSAEGSLYNPAIFAGTQPPSWDMAHEYLKMATKFPCPISYVRGHLFKIFHHSFELKEAAELRYRLSKSPTLEDMKSVVEGIKELFLQLHLSGSFSSIDNLSLPFAPWICQPYVRVPPEVHIQKMLEGQAKRMPPEDAYSGLSKKKKKKLLRNPRKSFTPSLDLYAKCRCGSPKGGKCALSLCRLCCRLKCFSDELDCPGHRFWGNSKKQKNRQIDSLVSPCEASFLYPEWQEKNIQSSTKVT